MTRLPRAATAALLLVAVLPLAAAPRNDFKPKPSSLPQGQIESAIRKGLAFIKGASSPGSGHGNTSDSLLLYALLHAGCPKGDPVFQKYLKQVVDRPPQATYDAALTAMCLSELEPVGYRWKLERIATFFVNTQCQNGQWHYGEKLPFPKVDITPTPGSQGVASGPGGQVVKPVLRLYGTKFPAGYRPTSGRSNTSARKIIRQQKRGPASGDNSNSQYAALGLKACAEAGFIPDPRCINDALKWWQEAQSKDGGWSYNKGSPWGSMTAGGVGAVAIFDWMAGRNWKADPMVQKGMAWIDTNWSVSKNPKGEKNKGHWQYYYLYAVERVGMIVGTDTIGSHDWFDEGARYLLKQQKGDGSWQGPKKKGEKSSKGRQVWDTCFAILYLRKATKPLVYSGPGGGH
jgi:hypothetical protein